MFIFVPEMKRLLYIIVPVLLSSACSRNAVSERLAEVDSLIVAELNDSAYHIVSSIDEQGISKSEDRAHYNLLMTQTSLLVNKPLPSDSLLDEAIRYYQQVHDSEHLADAYYYKGVSLYLNHDVQQSLLFHKKAETEIGNSGNVRQQYKIAEGIAFINNIYGNYDLALQYAKKALKLSKSIRNKRWKADAYYRIAVAFSNLNEEDSTRYYTEATIPYIKYVREVDLPYFLNNIGYIYKESDPKLAKQYFEKSLEHKELSNTLSHLADIYYDEGNKHEAYNLWKRALTVNDSAPKDIIILNLIEYGIENGNLDSLSEKLNEVISIRDSIDSRLKNKTIRNLQLRYDQEVAMRKHEQTVGNWQTGLLVAAILVLWLVAYIIIYRYREKSKMMDFQMQMNDLMAQIRELKASGRQDSETINMLNRQLKDLIDKEDGRLKDGMKLYNNILNGGNVSTWRKKDFALFIDYYKAIDFKTVRRLEETPRKEKLTEQKLFFLLLKEMGYDKSEIASILGISITSVNTLNTRTKPIE